MTEVESSTTTNSMSATTTSTAEADKHLSSPPIPSSLTSKMVNGSNDTSASGDHLETSDASSNKQTVNANNKLTGDNGNILNLGFDLDKLFTLASSFYRKYESKAFHPSYEDRNRLVALSLQAKYGPFKEEKAPSFGALDIVGRDRRQAWADLESLPNQDAKKEFIADLNRLCPLFRPFVEAHAREEEDRKKQEEAIRRKEEEERERRQQEMERLDAQKRAVQEVLNRQTYHQFLSYAEQQYPGEVERQQRLIRQLQEQHYQQYMQQVLLSQQAHVLVSPEPDSPTSQSPTCVASSGSLSTISTSTTSTQSHLNLNNNNHSTTNQYNQSTNPPNDSKPPHPTNSMADTKEKDSAIDLPPPVHSTQSIPNELQSRESQLQQRQGNRSSSSSSDDDNHQVPRETDSLTLHPPPSVLEAKMWTRKDIQSFKEAVRREGSEGIINIGHGEIVTIRVPTHEEGTCIFWEFCTDNYDIGFGVLFEWTENPGQEVSVHVTESEDEDDEVEEEVETQDKRYGAIDPEKGQIPSDSEGGEHHRPTKSLLDANTDVILPIFRRESHEEVHCGSHPYPGTGVYLLKFDNSYSLWRSKTLYYRVYYTR